MVESVQVFNYGENTPVRVRVMNGQTWFVAKDVCKVLGIEKARNAVSRLEDDERGPVLVDTLGGTQRMSAVSESGLYHLVFQSRKPEARKFRRWVTGEVLPQIRMTGGYRADLRRDESPAGAAGCDRGAMGASAPGGLLLRGRVYPKDRSAELGAFYAELRKWVLKEDEAAVAELAGVSPGHVAEVLAGRKPGYGVLCLLVEYATENRAAGRQRVVRSAARRAEQVEELRLDFMAGSACSEWHVGVHADMRANGQQTGAMGASGGVAPLRMGSTAREPQNRAGSHEADMRRGRPAANGAAPAETQAASRGAGDQGAQAAGSHETGHDVTDGIIDFNGMEG